MAVSPLIVPPTDALQASSLKASPSPLKRPPASIQPGTSSKPSSSNNTPRPQPNPSALASSANMDFVERLNSEERHKYVKGKQLGEGTYAIVFRGHLRTDPSQLVAIKKIKKQKEYLDGMPPDAVRELKHLQELQHPNIISLLSVFSTKDQNLNLVLEYLPLGDLEMLIRDSDGVRYGAADIKAWSGMLTRAVWFCHKRFVLHRDIKPNNCLIAADGTVKLADFGLARSFSTSDPYRHMTSNVITRWYRPPELLFGARHYGGAVDVWSVGLVIAELVLRRAFLPGNTEVDQIKLICLAIGTPNEGNWPGVTRLPEYAVPEEVTPVTGFKYYNGLFGTIGNEGVDLLMQTLRLDPRKRITAEGMLKHGWWKASPAPTRTEDLPRKAGGEAVMGADLKKRAGVVEEDGGRGSKVARKLDFGAAKKG